MTNSVIIVLTIAALVAWITWLIYNYAIFDKQVAIEAKVDYWKSRTKRIQDCVRDLVDVIHEKFPNSTIEYAHNSEIDRIEGEIKY